MTNAGLLGKALTYEGKPKVDAPCGSLSPILKVVFEGAPINIFSLEVEGAEPMVLHTIDSNIVMIKVMMIEVKSSIVMIKVMMIEVKSNLCQKQTAKEAS